MCRRTHTHRLFSWLCIERHSRGYGGEVECKGVPSKSCRSKHSTTVCRSPCSRGWFACPHQPNDIVHGFFPMARFFNFPAKSVALVDPSIKVSPSAYLGVLGLTGLSAYFPCKEIAAPRKGLVDKEGNAYQEVGEAHARTLATCAIDVAHTHTHTHTTASLCVCRRWSCGLCRGPDSSDHGLPCHWQCWQ